MQHDFGGSATPAVPGPAVVRFAERIMAAVSSPWLYSRVDVIETAEGPILMELELIEPDLFFNLAPSSADALAEGLLAGAIR